MRLRCTEWRYRQVDRAGQAGPRVVYEQRLVSRSSGGVELQNPVRCVAIGGDRTIGRSLGHQRSTRRRGQARRWGCSRPGHRGRQEPGRPRLKFSWTSSCDSVRQAAVADRRHHALTQPRCRPTGASGREPPRTCNICELEFTRSAAKPKLRDGPQGCDLRLWSGYGESNPGQQDGNLLLYH